MEGRSRRPDGDQESKARIQEPAVRETAEMADRKLTTAYGRHDRRWAGNLYVYPVVSRRSRGLSIGINLNPDKGCNYDCLYCQVDRKAPPTVRKVDLAVVTAELDAILAAERDGSLYETPPCDALTPPDRGIRDIAFSGDGEPTAYPRFVEAVEIAAAARERFGLTDTKLVVITDGAYLDRPLVREALELLDRHNGEVWAKLDAGTEEFFRQVNRPNISLDRLMAALVDAARRRPIVIRTLLFRLDGAPPPDAEVEAYIRRLEGLVSDGGQIKAIQLHTIARRPASPRASALSDAELDGVAALIQSRVNIPVEVHYGLSVV